MTNDIQRSLELFADPSGIVEIRALHCWQGKPEYTSTRLGYFDSSHLNDAANQAEVIEQLWNATGVYVTMNPVKPDVLARAANRIKKGERDSATKDHEIVSRRWMLLDFDPQRPAGVSSTDTELAMAEVQAKACRLALTENGFPEPIVAMSGNGWHLLYRIDLPAESKLVEQCLKNVAIKFPLCDVSTHNAARITKLYGTFARKGDSVPDRPHRRSYLAEVPETIETVALDRLDWLVGQIEAPAPKTSNSYDGPNNRVDIEAYLSNRNVRVINRDVWNGSDRWFVECPGIASHNTKNADTDCQVWQEQSGKTMVKCVHNSCGMHSWDAMKGFLGEPKHEEDYHREAWQVAPVNIDNLINSKPAESAETEVEDYAADDDDIDSEADDANLADVDIPAECLRPPGLIGEFIDATLTGARYPQPVHALAAGLAWMSLLVSRRIVGEDGTRPNLYVMTLGPTRSGKERGREVIKQTLNLAGATEMYEEEVASKAALLGFLEENPSGLLLADEFGDWLAAAKSKTGGNTQPSQILTALLKLFSSSGGLYKASRYADNSKQVIIREPHLEMLATSTAEVFWKNVSPEYLSGGLFGRIILFDNCKYTMPTRHRDRQRADLRPIVDGMRQWLTFATGIPEFGWGHPRPVVVPISNDALDRYEEHEHQVALKIKSEPPLRQNLWAGTPEITNKLALIFAASRSFSPLQVTLADMDLAIKLSNWATRRKVALCEDRVSENAQEDATKKVYRFIKDRRHAGISQRDLTRRTQWLKGYEREEIIKTLTESEQIVASIVKTAKRDKTIYLAAQFRNRV